MARQVGDLWPQASGSASLGAEMSGGGFTGEMRPFAHIHINSGVFHHPTRGGSGIIRFQSTNGQLGSNENFFGFSFNGGKEYPFEVGQSFVSADLGVDLVIPYGSLRVIASGLAGIVALNGSTQLIAIGDGIGGRGDNVVVANQQVDMQAFNGSGRINYRFGPYQAWHSATSNNNGSFFPLPHSGQVNQMIQEARVDIGSGLQNAYVARRDIYIQSAPGNLEITTDTAKTIFASNGTRAQINLSGVFTAPNTSLAVGDMHMMSHSVISGVIPATTQAIASAQALGIGTLALNTGSGLINVSVGSGIAMFAIAGTQSITKVAQTVNLNTRVQAADQNYGLGTGLSSGIITVFSPGLYKISYKVTNEKTVGTTPQTCTVNLAHSNTGGAVFGSIISTFHYDTTNAPQGTSSTVLLLNMNAGETIWLEVLSTLDGADNCRVANRGATMVIEKIGPKRGTAGS